jgi:hypothetical protein
MVPGLALIALALVAADPRPALGAAVYATGDIATDMQRLILAAWHGNPDPWGLVGFEPLVALALCGAAAAASLVASRRLLAT